jgi:hypothetical protein
MGRGILLWLLGVPIPIIPSGALLALIDMKPRGKGELALGEAAVSRPGAAVCARAPKFRR